MAISKKIIVKDNIFVSCPTCFYEIPVQKTMSLPREFSVLCPNCGGRKLYQLAQIHDRKQDTVAIQNSGRAQFAMKSTTVGDLAAVEPTQPKSLLNQFGSWLLQ